MITIDMLSDACAEQKEIWQKEWPEGMTVTVENLQRAQELNLSIEWFVHNKFSKKQYSEYDRVCAPARAEYDRVCASADDEYSCMCNTVRAEYDSIRIIAFITAWRKK